MKIYVLIHRYDTPDSDGEEYIGAYRTLEMARDAMHVDFAKVRQSPWKDVIGKNRIYLKFYDNNEEAHSHEWEIITMELWG